MKKNKTYTLLAAAVLTALGSCDVNDWNDKLDGFEELTITDVQTVSYTLTADDYSSIATNSDNVTLAGDDLADALSAVADNCYFTDDIPAKDYIPAFLADDEFEYFNLDDGSAINITYNVYDNHLPDEIAAFEAASEYTVTSSDYIEAWGSEEYYIEGFSPSTAATSYVPGILAEQYPDAESGDMVLVYYNEASSDPNFGTTTTEDDTFELTNLLGTSDVGDEVEVHGLVTALCTTGYILTDDGGSIFVYYGSSFDYTEYSIGDQIEISGTMAAYRTGLQLAGSSCDETVVGNQSYTYPTPNVYTGADMDEAITRTTNEPAEYIQFTTEVTVSGSYYNFYFDDAETGIASTYYATTEQKALFTDGETYTVTGYFINISSSKYVNFIVVSATAATSSAARVKSATSIATTAVTAVYTYTGSKWTVESDIAVLQSDDYSDMGQTYKNLEDPDYYLPIYLKVNFPYAVAEDTQLVGYKYYNSGTSLVCDQYIYDGSDWNKDDGSVVETAQFVKTSGEWMYDPNVTLTFEYSKGSEPATTYYQACVDWVYENIDKPLGSTSITSGLYYVTSYGNNEYYSGASAYYCNVDIRPSAAYSQYPDGYEGMSDDEIQELMKQRFCYEVMPGALATLHPDAAPVDGLEVIYTINFVAYTGSGTEYTLRYEVTGLAEFTFLDCTWWDDEE